MKNLMDKLLLSNEYKLIRKLGSGSFGEVYKVQNEKKKMFAAKVEKKQNTSRLKEEYDFYLKLEKCGVKSGIPKIITFIETDEIYVLVMQLLGKSLDEMLTEHTLLDIGTVLKAGISIVTLLEMIHNATFIHRDIKPNNFLVDAHGEIYIVDFGLSKQYITEDKHIGFRCERSLVGTARYASINVHMGLEPSRRDDLESVGYMLIYLLKGKLPWQGIKKQKDEDHVKVIGEVKQYTHLSKLCEDLPQCFASYIKYCRNLQFYRTPDYEYLKELFAKEAINLGVELKYCWQ